MKIRLGTPHIVNENSKYNMNGYRDGHRGCDKMNMKKPPVLFGYANAEASRWINKRAFMASVI